MSAAAAVESKDMQLLREVLAKVGVTGVARGLNVVTGTVRRWLELQDVPPQYRVDLMKMAGRVVDYAALDWKQKDQFFTPADVAAHCWGVFKERTGIDVGGYRFVEPSAGEGAFLSLLPAGSLGIDIEPRGADIVQADFLEWSPPADGGPYVVIGNPPFGLRGHLALRFLNRAAGFADYVAFILPQLFESDGRGSPRKRVEGGLQLIHSEKLQATFWSPTGTAVKVSGVFQIWSRVVTNPEYSLAGTGAEAAAAAAGKVRVYSISDGGSVATTRNKAMIGKCDIYLPSTCFGKEAMRVYDSFEALPGRKGYGVVFPGADKAELVAKARGIHWGDVSFLSTNSACNLRRSVILGQFL